MILCDDCERVAKLDKRIAKFKAENKKLKGLVERQGKYIEKSDERMDELIIGNERKEAEGITGKMFWQEVWKRYVEKVRYDKDGRPKKGFDALLKSDSSMVSEAIFDMTNKEFSEIIEAFKQKGRCDECDFDKTGCNGCAINGNIARKKPTTEEGKL